MDPALRYGNPPDSELFALPIAPGNRRILCASPAYVERHGMPASPQDLARHNCLQFLLGDHVHDRWRFFHGNREVSVQARASPTSRRSTSRRISRPGA